VVVGSASGPAASVSQTQASTSSSGGSAQAKPLAASGSPLGLTGGGSQEGPGQASGSAVDTDQLFGAGAPARLQVTPWSAGVTSSGSSTGATGDAAIARVDVRSVEPASVGVLQSSSQATYDPSANGGAGTSSGRGSSDAVALAAGNPALAVSVLHADANSSGHGSTSVLSVNGQDVVPVQLTQGICQGAGAIQAVALNCLQTSGGDGTSQAGAANAATGSGQTALAGAAFDTSATGATGATGTTGAVPPSQSASPLPALSGGQALGGAQSPSRAPSSLPLTGFALLGLLLVACDLLAMGVVIVRLAGA
jgi:hypothetical protein